MSLYQPPHDLKVLWQDTEDSKIEDHLREIAAEFIVAGEILYRARAVHKHEWHIQYKAELIECKRKPRIERVRRRGERRKEIERARIVHLLNQAKAFREAEEIRAYVEAAREKGAGTPSEFQSWSTWALAQADRMDPVKSGKFMRIPEEKVS